MQLFPTCQLSRIKSGFTSKRVSRGNIDHPDSAGGKHGLVRFFGAVVVMLQMLAIPAFAGILPAVGLAWNANPEPDIAGYELSYGTASGSYGTKHDVGLKTRTSVSGLSSGVTYYFVVVAYNSAGQRSLPSSELRYRGAVLSPWSEVPRSGWKVRYVDSEQPGGFAAARAIDGDPGTFWHTGQRKPEVSTSPHEIQIDLGTARNVKGFQYLPRQDGSGVGNIGKYAFFVSMNGADWGKPVATGKFSATPTEKRVISALKRGRFVRLVSLSDTSGNRTCGIAELNILQARPAKRKPSSFASMVGTPENQSVKLSLKHSAADHSPSRAQPAPAAAEPKISTEIIGGRKYLVLTVAKPALPDGRKRSVQVSSNLVDWFSGRNHTTVVADNERFLKVRDNTPLTPGRKRYIRLKTSPR